MNAPSIIAKLILLSFLLCDQPWFNAQAVAADADTSTKPTHESVPVHFDVTTVRRTGPIFLATSGQFDRDGKADVVLFHKPSKESYEKFCTVFFQRDGKYDKVRTVEFPLGEAISAVTITDIDSDGIDDLCAFDRDGMSVVRTVGDGPVGSDRRVKFQTLLPSTARQIAEVDWIADINSDGRPDVVLPAADGLHLFIQKSDRTFEQSQMYNAPIRASVRAEIGQSYVSYRLPALEFDDFDGDGRTDIGAFDFEQMSYFLTGGAPTPNRFVASPLVQKFTKDFIGATDFTDLNADGVPEAVIVLMSQKKNFQSEARIYFGKADLSYGDEPANVYMGDTNVIFPMFLDVTGDGKMEMLLQNINVGIGFFLNYFLRNRIRVDAELRKLGQDGTYEEEPIIRRAIYVRASDTGAEPAREVGDFNGDGLDDLVVGIEEDILAFFLSNREEFLPRNPTFELKVPAYGTIKTLELNADGRTDLVILYSQDDMRDTATLIISK